MKHYLFTFHDSLFECLATGYSINNVSQEEIAAASAKLVEGRPIKLK